MSNQSFKLPPDFDTWSESAQNAYIALLERAQAAESIIHSMQATFSDEDTITSLLEQDITPSWRTIMLHTLNDLFRKAAVSTDINEVLFTVTRIVTQMLHATSAYVCDFNAQHKTMTVLADYMGEGANELEQGTDIGAVFHLEEEFIFRLKRQNYWINHFEDTLDSSTRHEFDTYDIKTALYAPLIAEDELIGHIEIWETREKQDYSERQIEFVTALARQIASIVHSAHLNRALKESEERFRLVMSTMREGLVQVDENGIIEFANERFSMMLDCEMEELIGRSLDAVLRATPARHDTEAVIQLSSGAETILHISQAPIHNDFGEQQGAVYVFTDISRRKHAERSALELDLEKERVRILTQFVQDASHEFYTPLSNIGTHAYLLGRHLKDETHLRYLDIIGEQAEAIRSLISALVIMTRLDSTNTLRLNNVNIVDLLSSVVNRLSEQIQEKHHQLKLTLPDTPIYVACEVDMLLLAISNVIDNAIRYTPNKGFITIELRQEDKQVILIVEDTGIGMSKQVQDEMFKRFYRADKARSTRGFGLGMTITRRIIDLHFGEIKVESEEAQGTKITVALPLIEG